jgi:hypothetical protein
MLIKCTVQEAKFPVKYLVHIYIYIYDDEFLALLSVPYIYIYVISRLMVKRYLSVKQFMNLVSRNAWTPDINSP